MIYYIYKVRRKQTSIHFSRSALPHRYLRYISWISWILRPQAAKVSTLYKLGFFHTESQPRTRCFRGGAYILAAPLPLLPPGGQANALRSFLKKKKNNLFPFFRAPLRVAPLMLLCPQALARVARDPSAAGSLPASAALL